MVMVWEGYRPNGEGNEAMALIGGMPLYNTK